MLVGDTEVFVGFIYYGGGGHGEHSSEKETVHSSPTKDVADEVACTHHADHYHTCAEYGIDAHLDYLLERKFKSEREHEYDDSYLTPIVDHLGVDDGSGIWHVGACKKACYDVAEHERLPELFEKNGGDACYDEYVGKILNEYGEGFVH